LTLRTPTEPSAEATGCECQASPAYLLIPLDDKTGFALLPREWDMPLATTNPRDD
jgi:hypothetical protein